MTYQQAKGYRKALKVYRKKINDEIDLVDDLIEDNEDSDSEQEIGSLPPTPPPPPPPRP